MNKNSYSAQEIKEKDIPFYKIFESKILFSLSLLLNSESEK